MANQLLTISMITREALRILENQLAFTRGVNRQYDKKFAVEGAKIGNTLNIRKPARYIGREGRALAVEDHTETSVPLVLDTQFGVDVQFTSADLALSIDDFSKRILQPAVATVANKIDHKGLELYKTVYNTVHHKDGPGNTPDTLKTYLQAGAKLDHEACPQDGLRSLVLEPNAQVEIVDSLKGLFQSSEQIKKQYERGRMGVAAGFEWSMDQNVHTHVVGPLGGTPLVNGASQTGSTLVTDGWTAAAAKRLNKGDVFTIAGVYAVNPQSRQSTGQLRQFVVTADVSSNASGEAEIPISPAIVTSGAFQTVTTAPADNAAITVVGAANTVTPANLAYHRDAFALGCADLPLPGGVDKAARISDEQTGLSVRMVRQYDINTDQFPCRLDVLFGWTTLYPELACRIQG